jgi:8-oxo-dGTP diphosphatase
MNETEQKATPQEYVCGFMFDQSRMRVLLIRKQKPDWQRGLLNGIGGKIEYAVPAGYEGQGIQTLEIPAYAMAREFEEEAGIKTKPEDWTLFRTESFKHDRGSGAVVHFFYAVSNSAFWTATPQTFERLERVSLYMMRNVREQMLYNLPYLIEMALALMDLPVEHRPLP